MSKLSPHEQLKLDLATLSNKVAGRLPEAQGVLQTATGSAASKWGIHSCNHTALSDKISAFEIESATYTDILRSLKVRYGNDGHEEHLTTAYVDATAKVKDLEKTVRSMVDARASLRAVAPDTSSHFLSRGGSPT